MFMRAFANANSHLALVSLSGAKVDYLTKQNQDLGDGISTVSFLFFKSSVSRLTAKNQQRSRYSPLLHVAQPQ